MRQTFDVCLFSLTKAMKTGLQLSNQGLHITLTKGKQKLQFDRISRTRDGMLCGVELVPRINEAELEGELAFDAIDSVSGGEGPKGQKSANDLQSLPSTPLSSQEERPQPPNQEKTKVDKDKVD